MGGVPGFLWALAAALTAAGQPMQLVDVFDLLFGRNAADLAALLPGGMLGDAAPMVRGLLVLWSVLPLVIMWAATLLPETVRGAVNHATQAAPVGKLLKSAAPGRRARPRGVFEQVFRPGKQGLCQAVLADEPGYHDFAGLFGGVQRHDDALHGQGNDVLPQICALARTVTSWLSSWIGCGRSRAACRCVISCAAARTTVIAGMT